MVSSSLVPRLSRLRGESLGTRLGFICVVVTVIGLPLIGYVIWSLANLHTSNHKQSVGELVCIYLLSACTINFTRLPSSVDDSGGDK